MRQQPQPLQPKLNAHRLRVINRGMRKVREAKKRLRVRDEQRRIRNRVDKQLYDLKQERDTVMKQIIIAEIKLALIYNIKIAWEAGNFALVAGISPYLREIVAKGKRENINIMLVDANNEVAT